MLWLLLACERPPPPAGVPVVAVDLSCPPWVLVTGEDSAILRFETLDYDELLRVELSYGEVFEIVEPERRTLQSDYAFPPVDFELELEHPDLPGLRVLHEVVLSDLPAGEHIGWRVDLGAGEFEEGSFFLPASSDSFRVVFTGDTMYPKTTEIMLLAAQAEPDLYIHGGDIQYQTNPWDTWTGLMYAVQPITAQAPFMPAVGNHEDEGLDEFRVMFERFFLGAGDGEPTDYYGYSYGGVRFLSLNSESEHSLSDPESAQVVWLTEQLQAHAQDTVVVYFHRPIVTLAEHPPQLEMRALLHPLFVEHGVDLVFMAHNHSYERFELDGIPYIVDGGGGALLYKVDVHNETYPEDQERRLAAEKSMGFSQLDFGPDGIEFARYDIHGELTDSAHFGRE